MRPDAGIEDRASGSESPVRDGTSREPAEASMSPALKRYCVARRSKVNAIQTLRAPRPLAQSNTDPRYVALNTYDNLPERANAPSKPRKGTNSELTQFLGVKFESHGIELDDGGPTESEPAKLALDPGRT